MRNPKLQDKKSKSKNPKKWTVQLMSPKGRPKAVYVVADSQQAAANKAKRRHPAYHVVNVTAG